MSFARPTKSKAPDLGYHLGLITDDRPLIRPNEQIPGGVSAKKFRLRCDPDTTEIETVGVPAGLEGHIAFRVTIGVKMAGLE